MQQMLLIGFLAPASYVDIKSRKLSLRMFSVFVGLIPIVVVLSNVDVCGVLSGYGGEVFLDAGQLVATSRFAGMIPGVIALVLSFVPGEPVGRGDGLVLTAAGYLTGISFLIKTLTASLMLAWVASVVLIVCGRRKKRIPFIPFMLAGSVCAMFLT